MLDALGERYGLLPSEVLCKASTLDLQIFDVAVAYRRKEQSKADGTYNKTEDLKSQYSQQEMVELMERSRGKTGN
tara:strand:+ start:160 stop:384 length:225 start_codon:yes stop_codon:yes gene_type:complete